MNYFNNNDNVIKSSISTEIFGALSKFGAADIDVSKLLSNYVIHIVPCI